MNKPINIDKVQARQALDGWLSVCRQRIKLRFPKIDFDADQWPIRTLYQTPQPDWYFTLPLSDFAAKDVSYREVLRCLVAEMVLDGKPKNIDIVVRGFRELTSALSLRIFDLTLQDLQKCESDALVKAEANPGSAMRLSGQLTILARVSAQLANKGVLPHLGFHVRAEVKSKLRNISNAHRKSWRAGKVALLDLTIEAFNEALDALADNDPRLNALDRVAIAAATRALCAPSRINEILCSSVDDHVTVEDYAQNRIGEQDVTHRAYQMLIVTMKGSKGAQWGAKPVLQFMIDAFHYTTDLIFEYGKRSRMLVEWYQDHPETLYLPPELEYLRGQNISRLMLAKILYSTESPHPGAINSAPKEYFAELENMVFKSKNNISRSSNGWVNPRATVDFLPWGAVEKLLLRNVHRALGACRKVTQHNHFEGNLSKMLFLFDPDGLSYLPHAISYSAIRKRLKQTDYDKRAALAPTLFEKLGITMPVNGKIKFAEMDSHDPRRWLTTMALIHGEKLSDVLINKWANRSRLAQLMNYDFRTPDILAKFSRMPEALKLTELTDMSNGLVAVQKLEDSFGLKTAIVTIQNAGIAMTSMDLVVQATENRPVAKSSRGIIIIYPQRFGVCFHQHHEKPCRNYSNTLETSCTTCNEAAYVKGHIPTNDETRKVARQVFASVVRHLENLAHTYNRGIADDQDILGEHMLKLVEKGISPALLEEYAADLIDEFHHVKHLIKDKLFASRLEQAFVTMGVVKELDNPRRPSGALIKYHNPAQHVDPLLEVALDSHGGRGQIAHDEQALLAKYPQFAPKTLDLKDERHLVVPDDEDED